MAPRAADDQQVEPRPHRIAGRHVRDVSGHVTVGSTRRSDDLARLDDLAVVVGVAVGVVVVVGVAVAVAVKLFRRSLPIDPAPALAAERADLLIESVSEYLSTAGLLGEVTTARRGSWHAPCVICGGVFKAAEEIRRVAYADGTRPYVHAWHLEGERAADECRHGLVPASCRWCNGSERAVSYPRSRSFRARRPGRCITCSEAFGAGEVICKVSSPSGIGWAHAFHEEER